MEAVLTSNFGGRAEREKGRGKREREQRGKGGARAERIRGSESREDNGSESGEGEGEREREKRSDGRKVLELEEKRYVGKLMGTVPGFCFTENPSRVWLDKR